ncbi:hypothetical protein HDU99_000982, partial [Rhizoclosmatium hyalinum]
MHQSHSDNDDEDLGFEDVLALFKEKRKKKSVANEKKVKDAYANVTAEIQEMAKDFVNDRQKI